MVAIYITILILITLVAITYYGIVLTKPTTDNKIDKEKSAAEHWPPGLF